MTKSATLIALLLFATTAFAGSPEFFVFDNGVSRGKWTPEQQARTLKELGYDGISYNYTNNKDLAVWLKSCKAHDLKIYGLYVHTFLDKEKPYNTALNEAIAILKGSDAVLWITLREVKDKKRNYDTEAVKVVQDLADQAATNGLRVAIYPHFGMYVASAADAVRIVRQVNRPNVGASINLCHEFMSGNGAKLDDTLKLAAPFATLVSINGVDVAGKKYILRLDQGDFDLAGYLKKLTTAGYHGPVGLQCYSVAGNVETNLHANIAAWKKLAAELNRKD